MMSARLFLALRALIAVWCLIGLDPAWATPGQFVVLNGGIKPAVSADLTSGVLPSWLSHSRGSLATITDATGNITYVANNAILNSAAPGTQSVTTQVGVNYLINIASGTGSITLSGAATGTVNAGAYLKVTATTASLTLTVSGSPANVAVSAVTYETTPRPGDQVITQAAAYYGPAFDYDPVTHAPLGLRIEEARTNLFTYSATNNAAWAAFGSVVAAPTVTINNAVAPDGTTSATKVVMPPVAGANAYSVYLQNYAATAATYTDSIYLKGAVGGETLYISESVTIPTNRLAVTLTTSWQRFSLSTLKTVVAWSFEIGTDLRDGSQSSTPAQTIYVWGAQGERGSFPTSYIPTAASPVARAADVVQIVGPALAAQQGRNYALLAEFTLTDTTAQHDLFWNNGGDALYTGSGGGQVRMSNQGVGYVTAGNASAGALTRAGATASAVASYIASTGNSGNPSGNPINTSAISSACLGSNGSSVVLNGHVSKTAIYNLTLTASQLRSRTVLGAPF